MNDRQDEAAQWRSREKEGAPASPAWLPAQSPKIRSWVDAPIDRRQFVRIVEATLAMAGLQACWPRRDERSMPYVKAPAYGVMGFNVDYATTISVQGYAYGVIVRCFEGKPQKIEGNPAHPATLGASSPLLQASVLGLYDPDRLQVPSHQGQASTWEAFARRWQESPAANSPRLLTGTITSPTLRVLIRQWLQENPKAQWHHYETWDDDYVVAGAQLAFDRPLRPLYHFEKAKRIAAFDADFLATGPSHLYDARRFADGRDPGKTEPHRLYVAEPSPTITGAMADHRLSIAPQFIRLLLLALAQALKVTQSFVEPTQASLPASASTWITMLAKDLAAHRGESLVLVGVSQPPEVQALAWAINEALDAGQHTVTWIEPLEMRGPWSQKESLRVLVDDMQGGRVDTLIILGKNPVYDLPGDLRFAEALSKVPHRIYHGLQQNETAKLCQWQLPESHGLEAWGDALAFDGTVSFSQPLISPLFQSKSQLELVATLMKRADNDGYSLLRRHWHEQKPADFERWWQQALHDGMLPNTATPPVNARLVMRHGVAKAALATGMRDAQAITLHFQPSHAIWDGVAANNPWLQEMPDPMSSLTWDNAALISPALAKEHRLVNGDVLSLSHKGVSIRIPALVLAGQAERVISVALGYGRQTAGRIGSGIGVNAHPLRTSLDPWWLEGIRVEPTEKNVAQALTQTHHHMEARRPVRVMSAKEVRDLPREAHTEAPVAPRTPAQLAEVAWGMAIDLNRCIGCNACTAACQAENSIPSVGKEEVLRGREMHWIRVDRYFEGDETNPAVHYQPVPCMHCEQAPCEYVCPVGATVHDAAGLNEMVYNRCVGTRYCSNNCPYKVRRFNFFHYSNQVPEISRLQRNPNVSVRPRGVMEKCTYCIQRISAARIHAEKEQRPLRGDEVVPACAQACPTQAIIFGDVNDAKGALAQQRRSPRHYTLLEELDTKPRTSYLAKVMNPNPEMEGKASEAKGARHDKP